MADSNCSAPLPPDLLRSLQEPALPPRAPTLAEQVDELERRHKRLLQLTGDIIATLTLPTNQQNLRYYPGSSVEQLLLNAGHWERAFRRIVEEEPDRG